MGMEFIDGDSFPVVPTVYKREDYKRTKHESVFSNWKVLIGSNDWEDFKSGKDGVGRYRVPNLPPKSSPGLYELGVAVIAQEQARNLDSDDVLVAYLGQAESVRSRLQSYGRSGAHLRNASPIKSPHKKAAVTTALFEDIFSKQGSLLYRWAPMRSKREAEATEGRLLCTFDYAWNKGSNGERRHLDLLHKLGDPEFVTKRESGINTKGDKHLLRQERKLSCEVDEEKKSDNFLTSVLKFSRSRPQLVSERFDQIDASSVCGVILGNGGRCNQDPVKRRKRCLEHKGQRVCRVSPEKQKLPQPTQQDPHHKDSDVMCGVILPNHMEPCSKRPVPGRQRCEDHKGMRINAFLFLLNQTDREKTVKDEKASTGFCEAPTKSGSPCTRSSPKGSKRCWQHMEKTSSQLSPEKVLQVACGVRLCDGLICERSPVKGCKRCKDHKGMRLC